MTVEVVGAGGDVRQPVGDPEAALAVLLPLALGLKEGRAALAHGGDDGLEAGGQRLAGELVQERLGVEGIEMAGAAFHEEEDDASSAWGRG